MLLLSSSSLNGYGLHKIFSFVKEAGYDGLDLVLNPSNFDTWDEDYIKSLSDEYAVPVLSITAPDKNMNEKKVDKVISIAKKLGTQAITFSPPHFGEKNVNWFTKYLSKVKRDTRLSICVKNVEPKFIFFVIPEHKNATLFEIKKVTGDTTLSLSSIDSSSGIDILKAQKILGNSVRNILFNDKQGSRDGMLPGSAGGAISYLPLESFLMKLKISGYDGFITLKVRPNELGAGNNERVEQNLEYMKNYYKKHFFDYK